MINTVLLIASERAEVDLVSPYLLGFKRSVMLSHYTIVRLESTKLHFRRIDGGDVGTIALISVIYFCLALAIARG
jgi:hypothetical protein